MRQVRCIVVSLFLISGPLGAQFGELPEGAAAHWSIAGVQAEISFSFAMDPAHVMGRIPKGFRAVTLDELASRGDAAARSILAARPALSNYILASLAVALVDSLVVERPGNFAAGNTMAIWWVRARPVDGQLFDNRAKGEDHVVELAFWSTDELFAQQLQPAIPLVAAARIAMTWQKTDSTWQIQLMLADALVTGSCQLRGTATAIDYPLPQYSSVWAADSLARSFVVYTYYGHRVQPCLGSLRATGSASIASAIQTGLIRGVSNQTGWRARAAAYLPR